MLNQCVVSYSFDQVVIEFVFSFSLSIVLLATHRKYSSIRHHTPAYQSYHPFHPPLRVSLTDVMISFCVVGCRGTLSAGNHRGEIMRKQLLIFLSSSFCLRHIASPWVRATGVPRRLSSDAIRLANAGHKLLNTSCSIRIRARQ